jgi:uncharacterized protein
MIGNHFSLILLATNQCNADCDYCFENKTADRLSLEQLAIIVHKVMDYMDEKRIGALTIHWQGGEAMLLPPQWYEEAHRLIQRAAAARGKVVRHGLQTNMLAYSPRWNAIIADMFGNSVSTSVDYPNRYRKLLGRGPETYDALWAHKVRQACAAGITVRAIAVLNEATLALGAERFYTYFVEQLGITDFQINTPFPGGTPNAVKQRLPLDMPELIRFHRELADIWLERGYDRGVTVGPFDELFNTFTHREACLPCIWGQNCADEMVSIDAKGNVAQCDCWVTSYPEYVYGNIFEQNSFGELLAQSRARQEFYARPVSLIEGDCLTCDYLALCHGGCPVRTYTVEQTLFAKDPYCELYKALFQHLENRATQHARHAYVASQGDLISPLSIVGTLSRSC